MSAATTLHSTDGMTPRLFAYFTTLLHQSQGLGVGTDPTTSNRRVPSHLLTVVRLLDPPTAACWVWRALWEERKRRQKVQKAREESGVKWWDSSAAPKPMDFRLLDAVVFEGPSPSLGVFTSRTGEIMRRTAASLDMAVVRGRMAQLALGVFGGSSPGQGSHEHGPPPIALAHLSDGSLREVHGGAAWDTFVAAGARTGTLKALTPWAAPLAPEPSPPGPGPSTIRLRNTFRVVLTGSQLNKVQTGTQRVVGKKHVQHPLEPAARAAAGGGGGGGGGSVSLVPYRVGSVCSQLDAMNAQVVKLVSGGTSSSGVGGGSGAVRVLRLVADYVVQLPDSKPRGEHGKPSSGQAPRGGGTPDGDGRQTIEAPVAWLERVVEVEFFEVGRQHGLGDHDGDGAHGTHHAGHPRVGGGAGDRTSAVLASASALPHLTRGEGGGTGSGVAAVNATGGGGGGVGGGGGGGGRRCVGDFCGFDVMAELAVMDGNKHPGPGDGAASSFGGGGGASKVVTFRTVSAARQDAAAVLRRVAAAHAPGGGLGGRGQGWSSKQAAATSGGSGGGAGGASADADAALELRCGLEEHGWGPALAHWWLRSRAGLPISAPITNTNGSSSGGSGGGGGGGGKGVGRGGKGATAGPLSPDAHLALAATGSPSPHRLPASAYLEPKGILVTTPCDAPPEVWWPGRLVEVTWATTGAVRSVAVWLTDASGTSGGTSGAGDGALASGVAASRFSVAIAPRAPNSGRLVCVIPATLTSRLAALRGLDASQQAEAPGLAAGAVGAGGTVGWRFRVKVCDAMDPACEAFSAAVVVAADEADVLPPDKVWRARMAACEALAHPVASLPPPASPRAVAVLGAGI